MINGRERSIHNVYHEFDKRLVVLEERMKTMEERYDKGWALLREDMAKWDRDNQRWVVSLFIAAIILIPILSNSNALANLATLFSN